MAAPVGAEVGIFFDGQATVEEGDFIRTPTGRLYLVRSNRIQRRGKHVGRQHLRVVVMDPAHDTDGDAVHPIYWYARR